MAFHRPIASPKMNHPLKAKTSQWKIKIILSWVVKRRWLTDSTSPRCNPVASNMSRLCTLSQSSPHHEGRQVESAAVRQRRLKQVLVAGLAAVVPMPPVVMLLVLRQQVLVVGSAVAAVAAEVLWSALMLRLVY